MNAVLPRQMVVEQAQPESCPAALAAGSRPDARWQPDCSPSQRGQPGRAHFHGRQGRQCRLLGQQHQHGLQPRPPAPLSLTSRVAGLWGLPGLRLPQWDTSAARCQLHPLMPAALALGCWPLEPRASRQHRPADWLRCCTDLTPAANGVVIVNLQLQKPCCRPGSGLLPAPQPKT